MFKKQTSLEKLKNQHPYRLEDLPAAIGSGTESTPLEACTLDQIAFATLALEAEIRPISRRLNALRELYDLARKQGALGAQCVDNIFANEGVHA